MGTNYYYYKKGPCECCGRAYEPIHIGKSSCGWTFALHVGTHGDYIPQMWSDWLNLFKVDGSYIEDEYGTRVSVDEMIDTITNRMLDKPPAWSELEYASNHSEPGPNNLVQCKEDGRHCVGHGGTQGTFDYCVGEFF